VRLHSVRASAPDATVDATKHIRMTTSMTPVPPSGSTSKTSSIQAGQVNVTSATTMDAVAKTSSAQNRLRRSLITTTSIPGLRR